MSEPTQGSKVSTAPCRCTAVHQEAQNLKKWKLQEEDDPETSVCIKVCMFVWVCVYLCMCVYSILFYSILFSCWEDVMSVIWLQCTRVRSSKYIEILVFLQFCVCAERTDAVEDSLVAAAQV